MHLDAHRARRSPLAVLLVGSAVVLAACTSAGGGQAVSTGRTATSDPPGTAAPTTAAPTTTTTTTVPAEPGWTVVATEATGVAVDRRTVQVPDGSTITVVRFRAGQVHYDLHDGSQDPPSGSLTLGPNAQSTISPQEAPILLAAFNGGFKVTTNAGGTEINGHTLTPLVPGMASLVIDTQGAMSIGVWGSAGFPAPGVQVASVRQNLQPLLTGGQPSPQVGAVTAWGAMLGPGPAVARSALGEDAGGNILYAASMSTVPADLAAALQSVGAVTAMELDINPEWVQLDAAPTPGGQLATMVPGQNRPADQYQAGWSRDFVTVLAGGAPPVPPG